jgi:gamma-glutamylcyclotransferase (GGCT)/AIG2-like uncharacterized protein YtfP
MRWADNIKVKLMPGLVFVYGTLRRGQRNHYMLRSSPFLGMHVTEPCYTMLDLGSYPAVVRGGHCAITGELYRVTPPTLATLDELEDYPDRYDRAVITTEQGDTWIYLYQHRTGSERVIVCGDWLR